MVLCVRVLGKPLAAGRMNPTLQFAEGYGGFLEALFHEHIQILVHSLLNE